MPDYLTTYAAAMPTKIAVIDDRPDGRVETYTWAELNDQANRLGNVLTSLGAGIGTTIVWCGQNSLGVVRFINAARKIGATAVPLNYRLSDDEAAYVTDHCDASIVYVDADYAPMFDRVRHRLPHVNQFLVYGDTDAGANVPEGMLDGDALVGHASPAEPEIPSDIQPGATMIYTSGTTGKPKGALRRAATDPGPAAALMALIGYVPTDVYLTTGPLYHSGPGGFMGIAQALGQTVVVQRKFDPVDWLRLVHTYRVTSTFSAPTPIRMICNLPSEVKGNFDRTSMKRLIANAAPWSFALKLLYLADFPEDSLFEVYGSTELSVNCILLPKDQRRKPGSCGQPAPYVEVKLFDDDGNEVTGFGPENTGELFVRSAAVFADYYKQHDKYLEDRRGDFQTVGDIAYRDDEGYIYICDRKKDMIISGGMNIYPAEIEGILEQHADVYEAAVFGVPSEEWGETVHAVIVRQPGSQLDETAIDAHARSLLANYKIPRSISWAEELPKTGSGKILKRELRAPYWAGRSSQVG